LGEDLMDVIGVDLSSEKNKLYGRTDQFSKLLKTIRRFTEGNIEMVTVKGHSGMGKSVVIERIARYAWELD